MWFPWAGVVNKSLDFLIFVSGDFLKYFIQVFSICLIIEIFYQLGTKILGLRVINLVSPNLHTLFYKSAPFGLKWILSMFLEV